MPTPLQMLFWPVPIFVMRSICLSITAFIVLIQAGCDSTTREPQATAQADPTNLTAVNLVAVTQLQIKRSSSQPATVHAYYRAEVRARATGYVKELNADIGQVVQKGDVLAQLDVPEMAKQREIIMARIRKLGAEEMRFQSAVSLSEASVESAKAKALESEAQQETVAASLAAATAEYDRTEKLVSGGALQREMLDEARKKRDTEKARKGATQAAIDSANAQVNVAKARLAAAKADLDAAKAATEIGRREVEELDERINYATITAPFDGVVTHRQIELGDLVDVQHQATDPPLFVVSQVDKVRIRIPVPEADAAFVNPSDKVSVVFPSFTDAAIIGTVSRTSGSLDPSTRTLIAECDFENTDRKLIPGMFGQATIELPAKSMASTLPARAIRFDEQGNAYVYVVSDDDVVTIASIQTGHDDGNTIEILSGVEPGQKVIGLHLDRFTDGQKVRPL